MSYKISALTIQEFKDASPMYEAFSILDIRLGLEQIQDTPSFRPYAEQRWAAEDPTAIEIGPEDALERFTMISVRHQTLTPDDVKIGLGAIIDGDEFKRSCKERWAAWEIQRWVRPGEPEPAFTESGVTVDLGAMPEGPLTA